MEEQRKSTRNWKFIIKMNKQKFFINKKFSKKKFGEKNMSVLEKIHLFLFLSKLGIKNKKFYNFSGLTFSLNFSPKIFLMKLFLIYKNLTFIGIMSIS